MNQTLLLETAGFHRIVLVAAQFLLPRRQNRIFLGYKPHAIIGA